MEEVLRKGLIPSVPFLRKEGVCGACLVVGGIRPSGICSLALFLLFICFCFFFSLPLYIYRQVGQRNRTVEDLPSLAQKAYQTRRGSCGTRELFII